MKFQTLGNKRQWASVTVKNVDTVTITKGSPVFYKPDTSGTHGLDVLTDTSLAAANQGFFAGIALADIAATRFGDVRNYNFVDCVVALATRSATSAVWASYSAGAQGDLMQFSTALAGQAIIRYGAGSAMSAVSALWPIVLATTYVSQTTQASTLTPTGTLSTSLLRCFVRAM